MISSHRPSFRSALPSHLGWLPFGVFALVYLYAFPYFDKLRSANEMPRLLQTQEMVDKGHFWLDERRSDMTSQFDTSFGPDGKQYPNKAPGPSFLAVPVHVVSKALGATSIKAATWAFRVFAVTVPALLFLPFFFRLTAHFTDDVAARRTATVAYALASPAWVYGILFMSHQLAAVCAGAAFVAAVHLVRQRTERPSLAASAVGFFAAAAVMMDYQSAVASALIGIYVVLFGRSVVKNVLFATLGAAPIVIGLGIYHTICFGSPLRTGYHFSVDQVTRKGFMGIVGLSSTSAFSTTFMPSNGLFVLAPWVLLAFVGAFAIFRDPKWREKAGKEAGLCLAVFLGYLLFLSSLDPYMARGGWCVGPRYLTVSLPFAGWLASAGLTAAFKRTTTKVASLAAVVVGLIVYTSAVVTYPHWPERLQNPLYELAFRLLASGRSVHSLGTLVGLDGVWAVAPLAIAVLGLFVWAVFTSQKDLRTIVPAALLSGALIIGLYAFFPRSGPYAQQAWDFVVGTWEPLRGQ